MTPKFPDPGPVGSPDKLLHTPAPPMRPPAVPLRGLPPALPPPLSVGR